MASFSILVNDLNGRSSTDLTNRFLQTNDVTRVLISLSNYLSGAQLGSGSLDLSINSSALAASSATVTFSSIADSDTLTVNGIVFTAKTSGATGNQFNIGADDTAAATNAAAAINASTTAGVAGIVSASSSGAVVTISSLQKGLIGNAITIAISAHGTIGGSAVTGADSVKRLGGGTGANGSSVTSISY